MFCDPMVRQVHLQIRQSPVFIQAHLSLTPLGILPDPEPSRFSQGGLCFHLPKSFLQRFSTMSLSSSFLFLQASQTLGAGNARDSPRQARGERNSRWRWEPFGFSSPRPLHPRPCAFSPPPPKPRRCPSTSTRLTLPQTRWARCAFKVTLQPKAVVLFVCLFLAGKA